MTESGALAVLARSSMVILVALILQVTLVADLRVADVQADIMLLIGIAAGLAGGSQRGAVHGFAAGLAYDLMLTTPLGLSALTYALVAHLVGMSRDAALRTTWWIPVVTAAAASSLGVVLYVVFGSVLGRPVDSVHLLRVVVVVSVANAVLAPLAVRVMAWVAHGRGGQRVGAVLR